MTNISGRIDDQHTYFDSFLARKLISEVTELLRDHHPLESLQDLDESELEDVKVTRQVGRDHFRPSCRGDRYHSGDLGLFIRTQRNVFCIFPSPTLVAVVESPCSWILPHPTGGLYHTAFQRYLSLFIASVGLQFREFVE